MRTASSGSRARWRITSPLRPGRTGPARRHGACIAAGSGASTSGSGSRGASPPAADGRRGELDAAEKAYRSASRAGAELHPGLALLWLARVRTRAPAAAIGRALAETGEPLAAQARLLPARIEILLAARDHE